MKTIIHILNEIFDFFCGDWRTFWGMAVTVVLVVLIDNLKVLSFAKPATGFIFVIGIAISLVMALRHELT